MKFTKLYTTIFESKIDDMLSSSNIPDNKKDFIRQVNNKLDNKTKYIAWLIKNSQAIHETDIAFTANMLNWFDKNQSRSDISEKDIMRYNVQAIVNLYTELKDTKSKTQHEKLQKTAANKIYEDANILVVSPPTFESAERYTKGTEWCISNKIAWNSYVNNKCIRFYIIIDKTRTPYNETTHVGDKLYKVAIGIGPDGHSIGTWDAEDNKMLTEDEYLAELTRLTNGSFSKELLKPFDMTLEQRFIAGLNAYSASASATINEDGKLDVNHSVSSNSLKNFVKDGKLQLKFGTISGNSTFSAQGLKLTSLEGFPERVAGIIISNNELTNLKELANIKGLQSVNCENNNITSLVGVPERMTNLKCASNRLTSLEGAPKRVSFSLYCENNHLTTLKGAPDYVGDVFNCSINLLTSLEDAPKYVGATFICKYNKAQFTKDDVIAATNNKNIVAFV